MADLEMRNYYKSFGGIEALKGVNLSCSKGEVHALLGENGAGKSTLLKMLSGAYQPDQGEIHLFGKKIEIRNPVDAMNYGIGTVYQELSTIPDMRVSENIFFGSFPKNRLGDADNRQLRRMTRELCAKYKVEDLDPDEKAGRLPLSKRQMIEILRVLSRDPKVVILDEATSALTEERVEWLLDLARQLADEGKIVIFISHRMAEIRQGCDTMTILRNGESVARMSVKDANMDEVVRLMLGRSMEGYFPEIENHSRSETSVEVENLSDNGILSGVGFSALKGEVLGVGGLAGQGQAELLQALFGMHPAKGTIRICGRETAIKSAAQALKHGIALVPEDRAQQGAVLSKSIGFNISLPNLKKLSKGLHLVRSRENDLVSKYMNALSIKAPSSETPVHNLSGGNQQKVVMAKIMAAEPDILLMHDITRGVDVGTKKEMFQLVRDEAEKGKTVIYFSTDADELVHICDRVIIMFDGHISATLSGKNLTRENIVAAAIGERVQEE